LRRVGVFASYEAIISKKLSSVSGLKGVKAALEDDYKGLVVGPEV